MYICGLREQPQQRVFYYRGLVLPLEFVCPRFIKQAENSEYNLEYKITEITPVWTPR